MQTLITEIIAKLRSNHSSLDTARLGRMIGRYNRGQAAGAIGKQDLLDFYTQERAAQSELWKTWQLSTAEDRTLLQLLTLKPRRTASGVATISVVTMPHGCSGSCVFCPNDIRMPKSYLAAEPACQRAERNYFDPYLQVRSRLALLEKNGHVTDKIELIVLGGSWSDYPEDYQRWFACELFCALNDTDEQAAARCEKRIAFYEQCGVSCNPAVLEEQTSKLQAEVNAGTLSYNQAIARLGEGKAQRELRSLHHASEQELDAAQRANESSSHRVVGLTFETRPDLITRQSARQMRRLGATKLQMGVQSLNQQILDNCGRNMRVERIAQAFACLREAGFKIVAHMMLNLPGATPQSDVQDYVQLVSDPRFLPDEVKLYPCVLVESSALMQLHEQGLWQSYDDATLIDVLAQDLAATPGYVRISRMIRDISAGDIVAGSTTSNLRQLVEAHEQAAGHELAEIRQREIANESLDEQNLQLKELSYTSSVSREHFVQWVDAQGRIAGFVRLSLPDESASAMIRELHVYGRVAELGGSVDGGAQHIGLGKQLVERACELAMAQGYTQLRVISSVGTRPYYRRLGFVDEGLYQSLPLV